MPGGARALPSAATNLARPADAARRAKVALKGRADRIDKVTLRAPDVVPREKVAADAAPGPKLLPSQRAGQELAAAQEERVEPSA